MVRVDPGFDARQLFRLDVVSSPLNDIIFISPLEPHFGPHRILKNFLSAAFTQEFFPGGL